MCSREGLQRFLKNVFWSFFKEENSHVFNTTYEKQTMMLIFYIPVGKYMLKVNTNTRTKCEICSKLTIKTPERRH